MADSDDDFVPAEDVIDVPSSPSSLLPGTEPRPAKKPRRQCNENVRYSPPKNKVELPKNLQQISQMKNAITKQLRGKDIDANLSLRIVKASLEMQETHLRFNQKIGKKENKGAKPPTVRNTICKLFSISSRTYSNIMSAYLSDTRNRVVYSSGKEGGGRSGNRSQKITRIPRTRELQIRVREFVRLCRGRRERVTARQVVDFLEDEGMLHIPVGSDGKWDKKQFEAAYRNTRLFVGENFVTWWKDQLLPNLHQPSLIMLDKKSLYER